MTAVNTLIYETLAAGNTSLASRKKIVETIANEPDLVAILLTFTFDRSCKVKVLASIILDDLFQKQPQILDAYLSEFITQLPLVQDESVKRLTSKIAAGLVEKRSVLFSVTLEEQVIDQSLVWLTTETKVATEANAMQIIMLLYKKFPTKAKLIGELIEVRFPEKTPAYQSKARKFLKLTVNS